MKTYNYMIFLFKNLNPNGLWNIVLNVSFALNLITVIQYIFYIFLLFIIIIIFCNSIWLNLNNPETQDNSSAIFIK